VNSEDVKKSKEFISLLKENQRMRESIANAVVLMFDYDGYYDEKTCKGNIQGLASLMSEVTSNLKCLIDSPSDFKKSGWNYRIMKRKVGEEEVYSIYEVYYDDVSDDNTITNFTESPVTIETESFTNMKNAISSLHLMSDDSRVLDYDKLYNKLRNKKNGRRKRTN
jgi:hypothetical protein